MNGMEKFWFVVAVDLMIIACACFLTVAYGTLCEFVNLPGSSFFRKIDGDGVP